MQIWKLWKLLQLMPHVFNTRTRVEGNDEIIGYAIVISVSILYSRHFFIAFPHVCMTHGLMYGGQLPDV